MLETIIVGLLAVLGGVSLVLGVSTLRLRAQVSTLEARVSTLESENRGLRELLEERTSRLEEADRGLRGILEERDSRLKLLEERVLGLEERLEGVSSRVTMLGDLVETLVKQPEGEPSSSGKQSEELEDPDIVNMKILVLRKQGYSIRQIAKELGIPKSTVHKRLKQLIKRV